MSCPFFPDQFTNVDFVQYPGFLLSLMRIPEEEYCPPDCLQNGWTWHRRSVEPVELDTTQVSGSNNGKIYTNIVSEDKQWLMAIKINTKNPKTYNFTTFLFDKNLELQDRHRIPMLVQDHADLFTNFELDNEGQLVFTRFARTGNGDYLTHVSFVSKGPQCGYFRHSGYRCR